MPVPYLRTPEGVLARPRGRRRLRSLPVIEYSDPLTSLAILDGLVAAAGRDRVGSQERRSATLTLLVRYLQIPAPQRWRPACVWRGTKVTR